MTPNKLAVYFVADMVLADMVVAANTIGLFINCRRFCCCRCGLTILSLFWLSPFWLDGTPTGA